MTQPTHHHGPYSRRKLPWTDIPVATTRESSSRSRWGLLCARMTRWVMSTRGSPHGTHALLAASGRLVRTVIAPRT